MRKILLRRHFLTMVAAVACCSAGATASAQVEFPSRPIRIVVPFPAGGGIDLTARLAAQRMSQVLGQQVVVENQGGGGGSLGTSFVIRAEPDGYTLLYHSVTGIVHSAVTKDLPYDWLRDLRPVSLITRFAPVMIVPPSLPVSNLQQFITLLKDNPGKYSYASSGTGTAIHLASEMFKQAAGVDIVHVPYRGTGAAMPDLIAGRVAMMIDGVPIQAKNIEGGIVRALAVTTRTRSPALPTVPTMKEEGLDYEVPFWTALYAPAKTPAAVVAKLAAAAQAAMKDDVTAKRLADVGTESVGSDPVELDRLTREQYSLYSKLVQDNRSLVAQ
jgi:tripartite-type tricarboxylate transporter receptor subunit TctC